MEGRGRGGGGGGVEGREREEDGERGEEGRGSMPWGAYSSSALPIFGRG